MMPLSHLPTLTKLLQACRLYSALTQAATSVLQFLPIAYDCSAPLRAGYRPRGSHHNPLTPSNPVHRRHLILYGKRAAIERRLSGGAVALQVLSFDSRSSS